MKRLLILLFIFISSIAFSQEYDDLYFTSSDRNTNVRETTIVTKKYIKTTPRISIFVGYGFNYPFWNWSWNNWYWNSWVVYDPFYDWTWNRYWYWNNWYWNRPIIINKIYENNYSIRRSRYQSRSKSYYARNTRTQNDYYRRSRTTNDRRTIIRRDNTRRIDRTISSRRYYDDRINRTSRSRIHESRTPSGRDYRRTNPTRSRGYAPSNNRRTTPSYNSRSRTNTRSRSYTPSRSGSRR